MSEQKKIIIGKIVAPHGVRGDVRVEPITDFPERFQNLKSTILASGEVLHIERVKFHQQSILIKFKGCEDRDAAGALKGKLIHVEEKDVFPLPEGRYYEYQIIGLDVYTRGNEWLGKVVEIIHTGSNDVYVTEKPEGKSKLIPALKKVVQEINLAEGKIVVELQEEWD